MAYQRQVVGNVPDASARIVVTELNIQTPMKTVLDFPMTSDRLRNALGVDEGGSGVPLDRDAYRRSVEFWRTHANWRG